MWEVDQDTIMDLGHKGTRVVFAAIWKAMDASSHGKSQMVSVDDPSIKDLVHRQIWWEALKELEDLGIIKRWRRGSGWTMIMVNPFVLRPWWMKDKFFDQAMDAFRKGPAQFDKEIKL